MLDQIQRECITLDAEASPWSRTAGIPQRRIVAIHRLPREAVIAETNSDASGELLRMDDFDFLPVEMR